MSKGRRVYRKSKQFHKRRVNTAVYVLLLIIILAVLIFLGYSIGAPIIKFLTHNSTAATETEPWTPPASEPSAESVSDTSLSAEETVTTQNDIASSELSAYTLPAESLLSAEALSSALESAKKQGYTSVIVVLKEQGGKFYYATESEFAASAENIIVSKLKAGQIVSIINSSGLKPIAKISTLNDNNRYGANRDGSYRMESDQSTWLDDSPDKGGKPWLSPFSADTQEYIGSLADEISLAGFETLIFDDVVFPNFRNSDLNYIGESVKSNTRYKALINIVNIARDAAVKNKSAVVIEISASDIINDKAEVLKPSELTDVSVAVNYSSAEITAMTGADGSQTDLSKMNVYDKTTAVFTKVKSKADGMIIIPYIKTSSMPESELADTDKALKDLGYDSYMSY